MAKRKIVAKPVEPMTDSPPLRLEYRTPQELNENCRNWRVHPPEQIAALTDTIATVGWAGAILMNERTGLIIDGHARKKVAIEQGATSVPVLIGDWSEEQEKTILATFDPIAAMATADAGMLAQLLAEISDSTPAIDAMLAELSAANPMVTDTPEPGAGGDEFDATPDSGPTRTALGDLWLIGGRHRLFVGDCTVPENVTRLMGGAKPHLMVTDPPYGVEYDPDWRNKALRSDGTPSDGRAVGTVTNDDRADWREAWALFPGDVAYCWHAGRHASSVQASLEAADFEIRCQIIWAKNMFAIGRGDYHWKHEPCWYAVRKGKTGHYNGDRSQTTVWEIDKPRKSETGHSTQKPVECMAKPIENNSNPGDAIYDPFLGSGTTLIAAHRLNRTCYGMEISDRYADVILKRCEAEGMTVEKIQ